jgi:hypothetical protein
VTQPPEYQPPAQPPYAQPPQTGQTQYGQPQYGQSQYGQPQYGEPPTRVEYGQPPVPQYGQPPAYPQQPGIPPQPGAAPVAGWPAAAPARKRNGLIIGLVIGAIGLLVLCVLGVGAALWFGNKGRASLSTSAPTGRAPSAKPPAGTHFTGDLRTILLKAPAGAQTGKPNSANDDGTVSLENAASFLYFNQAGAANQLRSFGYARGAMVAFSQSGYQVTSALFQFQDASGANRVLQSIIQGYESDPALVKKGNVPGAATVRYVQPSQTIGAGLHVIIAYYAHDDLYGSVLYYSQDVADPSVLTPFVTQQLALLP